MIASKEIVTDVARSGARVFWDPAVVNQKDTDETIPRDGKTSRSPPRLTSSVQIGGGPSISPTMTGRQDIRSPSRPIVPMEVRNTQPLPFPLMEILPNVRILRQLSVSQSVGNSPTNPSLKSTHNVVWTSRVMPSSPEAQTSWIWGSHPSTHRMNAGPSASLLPES